MSKDIVSLLQVCDLAKQWPQLQALHDVAMQELVAATDEAKKELARRREAPQGVRPQPNTAGDVVKPITREV